jgi:hypothetical protein
MIEAGIGCSRTDATARDPIARAPAPPLPALPRARDDVPRERAPDEPPRRAVREVAAPPPEPDPLLDRDGFDARDDWFDALDEVF